MAANGFGWETFFVEVEGTDCVFHHGIDVGSLEGEWTAGVGGLICADDVGGGAGGVVHDGMDASGKGPYGTGRGVGGVVTNDAAACPIFFDW